MVQIEKQVLLQAIDAKWREHILRLDHLRSVIHFRQYAQRDPLNEYKTEAFQLFETMLESLRQQVTQQLCRIRPVTKEEQEQMMSQMLAQQQAQAQAEAALQGEALAAPAAQEAAAGAAPAEALLPRAGFDESDPSSWGNPSRNDPCPCGSGEKFKHCHGRLA